MKIDDSNITSIAVEVMSLQRGSTNFLSRFPEFGTTHVAIYGPVTPRRS